MTRPLTVPSARLASLTTPQLAALQRLWQIARLPPISGYGIAVLAIAAAHDPTLADTLSSVEFNDAGSVGNGIDVLRQWRQRTVK